MTAADDLNRWHDRIAHLLAHGGPVMAYQPIIDLTTGRVAGHEALARFADGRPDEWFDAAHATGQATALELACVRNALTGTPVGGRSLYVSVNLCPHTICEGGVEWLTGEPRPEAVLLEVTEHYQVDDYAQMAECLAPLRAAGVRLAIDDVGSGWASFRHVLELAPDAIKLDRALVANVGAAHEEDKRALVMAMALFSARVGCRMVAEGVETAEEAEALRILGVRYGQGYHWGRPQVPMPVD